MVGMEMKDIQLGRRYSVALDDGVLAVRFSATAIGFEDYEGNRVSGEDGRFERILFDNGVALLWTDWKSDDVVEVTSLQSTTS